MPVFAVAASLVALLLPISDPAPLPQPLIPPATIDNSLEITGEALAAEQLRSRLFIEAHVNGAGPFRFLVDSGADRSVIGSDLARRLALPLEAPVRLRTMAASSDVPTVRIDTLTLGRSDIDSVIAPTLPEKFIGAQGIIGIDALADQRLSLDFDAKTVTIQDSRVVVPPESGEIVVTARRRKGQLILTEVNIDGSRSYAVIDTGAEMTVGNRAMLARLRRSGRLGSLQTATLVTVAGEKFDVQVAVLPDLRIGGLVLSNVAVAFTDAPPFALFGLEKQPALLLGTDLLSTFRRVSLDFGRRKVRFVMRRGSAPTRF